MPDPLTEGEKQILMPLINLRIAQQEARIFLEQESLDILHRLKGAVENGNIPDDIQQVHDGMVTLDMLNSTRGPVPPRKGNNGKPPI